MERPETTSLESELTEIEATQTNSPRAKRRKAAAVGVLILMAAAFVDASILDDVGSTASGDGSPDQSEVDAFEQVELMLAQAEAEQAFPASDATTPEPTSNNRHPRPFGETSPGASSTLTIPPLNGTVKTQSDAVVASTERNSLATSVQPVSRPVAADLQHISPKQESSTPSGSSGVIRLRGTIAPLP